MSGRLDGKVCVITGAAGGIGREAALRFAAEGARVCVADVVSEPGEQTAASCGDAFFQLVDVTNEESVAAMFASTVERYGGIDVIYNNAGIMPPDDVSVLDTPVDTWMRVLAVNATGVFLGCKHGIPRLLERGGGSVINVASFVALMGAAVSQIAYTASKGAVLSMTRELAVEFARRGVRVNALCPGPSRRLSCCACSRAILPPKNGASSTCRWDVPLKRARSRTRRCSSRATSPRM
jgi:NAD(P)-dependent dehydrogenase (short-subunit alcohol dehydrogenase family)